MAIAKNKTQATRSSVAEFLGRLDDERRKDCQALVRMLRRVTKAAPKMWGPSIVGFGDDRLVYDSGRELEWFVAGFSPRKKELVLYGFKGPGFDEALMGKLGMHSTGKGCLYIRRLADVDVAVLEKIAVRAARGLKARGK